MDLFFSEELQDINNPETTKAEINSFICICFNYSINELKSIVTTNIRIYCSILVDSQLGSVGIRKK